MLSRRENAGKYDLIKFLTYDRKPITDVYIPKYSIFIFLGQYSIPLTCTR